MWGLRLIRRWWLHPDRWLILKAVVYLATAWVLVEGFRVRGRWSVWLGEGSEQDAGLRRGRGSPDRLVRSVEAVCRVWPKRPSCLVTALAMRWLLLHHGWPARVRIGVRRSPADSSLEAHAWVEWGTPRPATGFYPFP